MVLTQRSSLSAVALAKAEGAKAAEKVVGRDGSIAPHAEVKRVKLGDIAAFSKGSQINGDELSSEFPYPFLNGGVNPSGNWKEANCPAGTITVSEGGNSCGYVNFMEKPFWCGAHCYFLTNVKGAAKYVYYALKSQQSRLMAQRSGACMPNIKKKDLGSFEFQYNTDISEQRRIAAGLDKISEMKRNVEARLKKLDLLVKARFNEMFGDPVTNPKGWKVANIKDFADIKIGPFGSVLHKEDYVAGGHPLVNPSHMENGKIVVDESLTITEDKYNELDAYHLYVGDVVIARRGEIGRCALVESTGLLCGTGSMFVRIKGDCRPDYLQRVISYPTYSAKLDFGAVGVTMKNINAGMIADSKVPLPPMEVQRQFAEFVEKVDALKAAAKAELEKVDLLYRAKLQEYFG